MYVGTIKHISMKRVKEILTILQSDTTYNFIFPLKCSVIHYRYGKVGKKGIEWTVVVHEVLAGCHYKL